MAFFSFTDQAKKAKQILSFKSVTTGEKAEFPAFITKFDDSYTVNWGGSGPIFGRTDPVKNYQSTSRRISVAFDILGENLQIATENFESFSKLIRMLYPVYSNPIAGENNARTIKSGPLIRVKYVNYIKSGNNPDGLLGCIGGFNFATDFGAGHFHRASTAEIIPLKYSVAFTFEPIHEQPLGASEDSLNTFLDQSFPYASTIEESPSQPAVNGNIR